MRPPLTWSLGAQPFRAFGLMGSGSSRQAEVMVAAGRGVITRHQLDGGMGAPLNRDMGLWMEVWVPIGWK